MTNEDRAHGPPLETIERVRTARTSVPIDRKWQFRQADDPDSAFVDTQGFPTEIHLDLLHHERIPDPFTGQHERQVQWVGEKSWIYRTKVGCPVITCLKAVLVFHGLDTYATVRLNGKEILKTNNMFVPERVDLTGNILHDEENILEIEFESTYLVGKKMMEENPSHKWGCWNGDPSRLAVRKAQYHYGWDWGPTLLTCGPWKPIYLELFDSRISDLYFLTEVDSSLEAATVIARVDFEGKADHVRFKLSIDGECVASCTKSLGQSHTAEAVLRTTKPKLWYPRKYGEQPLYLLTANLVEEGALLDTMSKRFGLRRARVVQRGLCEALGTTFMFEINNIPIFCGGSNWIPAHNFQTLLDPQKYRDWVALAADGNQVMLRVWGGGIYEQDSFYDACDELGILVWQDFLFACGNYPADKLFLDTVKREAFANVRRLRHHPCIVLWAGNNEDYQYRETENLDYDPDDSDPSNWLKSTFPARYIYEKLLKDVTNDYVPGTYYHFGSPYGGQTTADPTIGDLHQWNVWHGTQERYQDFDKLSGRFVSEFGMEALPNMRTIDSFLPDGNRDIDRFPQSSTVEFHNKAAGHERRLASYLAENIRYKTEPFEHYVYATQIMQAEAVGAAYLSWKRQWKGPGHEYCAGALVWQMNDCWPTISWSIVDHFLRPKLAYFAVKREMEPFTIGMKRTVRYIPADSYTRVYMEAIHEIEVWACNFSLEKRLVSFQFFTNTFGTARGAPGSQTMVNQRQIEMPNKNASSGDSMLLLPNRTTEIIKFRLPVSREYPDEEAQTIVNALMYSSGNPGSTLIARAINWPEPLKHVHFAKPTRLTSKLGMFDEEQLAPLGSSLNLPTWWKTPNKVCMLMIDSDVPLKGVQVEAEDGEMVVFDDQGYDVMADRPVIVRVWGLEPGDEKRLNVRHLGM